MSDFVVIQEFKATVFGMPAECRTAFYSTMFFKEQIEQHCPALLSILGDKVGEFFQDVYCCSSSAYYDTDQFNASDFEQDLNYCAENLFWVKTSNDFRNIVLMEDWYAFEWLNKKIKNGEYV